MDKKDLAEGQKLWEELATAIEMWGIGTKASLNAEFDWDAWSRACGSELLELAREALDNRRFGGHCVLCKKELGNETMYRHAVHRDCDRATGEMWEEYKSKARCQLLRLGIRIESA